jgi:hypothetical protein
MVMARSLTPRIPPGQTFYVLDLDVITEGRKKRTTRGLETGNKDEAETIAHDYSRLLERPDLTGSPEQHIYDLSAFKLKAVELIIGKGHPALLKIRALSDPTIGLTQADMDEIKSTLQQETAKQVELLQKRPAMEHPSMRGDDVPDAFTADQIPALLEKFMPAKVRGLNEQVVALKKESALWKTRFEDAQRELDNMRRRFNTEVKVTLYAAFEAYKANAKFARLAEQTRKEMDSIFLEFVNSLADGFQLADLKHTHVETFLDKLTKMERDDRGELRRVANGAALSVRSRQKVAAYLSSIITWMYRHYDLSENPVSKLAPLTTPKHDRYEIQAIRSVDDLREMLETLQAIDSYWCAWVAVAMLAGPRWNEQRHLHIADVDLSANIIDVRGIRGVDGITLKGTKTGGRRRPPIEQTLLLPILKSHVEQRALQQKNGTTAAALSPWLFPSTLAEHAYMKREKSLPGTWSSNKAWSKEWADVALKCIGVTGDRYYWHFGPDEFRHSACTALGATGIDRDRGSDWMGNSPKIFARHYCQPSSTAAKWALVY